MNLFALTDIAGSRIIRFPLSADLQRDIESTFVDQRDFFFESVIDEVIFDGQYTPLDYEILVIQNFVDVDGVLHAVGNPLAIDQYDPQVHSLDNVKSIFCSVDGPNGPQVLFQVFERRRVLARNALTMFYANNQFQKITDTGLSLDSKIVAVVEAGVLKFHSFHFAKRIFDLSDYYREATNEEVVSFTSHEKLKVEDPERFLEVAGSLIRRKISFIRQSAVLEENSVEQIAIVAESVRFPLQVTQEGRIVVPNDSAGLRSLLRFLDEDYYESPLSRTLYLSSSKRKVT
ncbi:MULTISPECIES: Kiwa anti-phage protein KwaB-like domain-containing protein [unclassified Pseudomonas]|uniref:Kiwa anti-phage protein KwaB-like domain-containing protein n=1 Tax=unclassified Pseudomonas TaxID=196821 RepID=UPI00236142B7|nr:MULTISPECIES: Kiwa anti-phage protein KwaB-like domain-containing protein [unclassified Pseudomonas]